MNFKKIEKLAKIYEKIKSLDAEIIEIDRMAMLAANGEIKASFELKIEDLAKQKEDEAKVSFDEDGSLQGQYSKMMRSMMMPTFYSFGGSAEVKKVNEHTLKQEVSESVVLSLLGVLLFEKKFLRDKLISQMDLLTA